MFSYSCQIKILGELGVLPHATASKDVTASRTRSLWVAGHSLGGALATLFTAKMVILSISFLSPYVISWEKMLLQHSK